MLRSGEVPDIDKGDCMSMADSRDTTSVLRCGPCADFEKLVPFETLTNHAAKFRACASQEDIKKTGEETAWLRKLYSVLSSACKAALRELESAIAKYESNIEKLEKERQGKAKKAGAEAKKKRAEATKSALAVQAGAPHPIFDLEGRTEMCRISSASEINGKKFLEPFLWTLPKGSGAASSGVTDNDIPALAEDVRKEVEKFSVQFAESTLKVLLVVLW